MPSLRSELFCAARQRTPILIARSVTTALMNLALELRIPVIHEVLLLDNEEQAKARCLGKKLNRGTEAARAAVSIARTVNDLSLPTR